MSNGHFQRDSLPLEAVIAITNSEKSNFGSGFVFRQSEDRIWMLTCAHVVRAMGGADAICLHDDRVDKSIKPKLVSKEGEYLADLAVLEAKLHKGQHIKALTLGRIAQGSANCRIPCVGKLNDSHLTYESLNGSALDAASLSSMDGPGIRFRAWKLKLDEKTPILHGHSGSPVICTQSHRVFAVASHKQCQGSRGYAVCLSNLAEVWPGLPDDIRALLGPSLPGLQPAELALLYSLFKDLPDSTNIDACYRVCRQSLRSAVGQRLPMKRRLPTLIDWLIDTPLQSNNRLPLYDLLHYLGHNTSNNQRRDEILRLENRLVELNPGIETQALPISDPDDRKLDYVSVEVLPSEADGSSDIRVCVRSDDKPSGRCVLVLNQDDGGRLKLDDRNEQQLFIGALREAITQANFDTPRIEFFLPLKLLSLDVDRWRDRIDRPLGTVFQVIIRSLDRRTNPEWRTECPAFLQRIRDHWNDRVFDSVDGTGLWWHENSSPIHEQADLDVRLGQCTGVALTHSPDPDPQKRENNFFQLLYRGVPLLIWPREADDARQLRKTVGGAIDQQPLCNLPEAIFKERKSGSNNDPWSHLSLLWDGPSQDPTPNHNHIHIHSAPKQD